MSAVRRIVTVILFGALALALAACNETGGNQASEYRIEWRPLFGDFTNDTSEVVARVGDIELTQRMIELYIDELPPRLKSQYTGPDGQRLALKRMIDQTLMVTSAMEIRLYNDQDVARQLISQRRNTLDYAMRNYGLLRGKEPTEEELRKYFEDNRDKYRQAGNVMTRHVECLTRADAELAYKRLMTGEYENNFLHVVADMSVNEETKKEGGNTGWFTKGGFIPYIRDSEEYADKVFDLEIGLHPPIQVADRWHVVEVTHRENSRPQTYAEARETVRTDMMPAWQDAIIKDYLLEARTKYGVEMLGQYAPGQGATPAELFNRALAVRDPQQKIDLLNMIYTDYPQSDKADDALFMMANVSLDHWQDVRVAERYLRMLLEEYPDSELREDATFLRENLYNPRKLNPQSIEDLKEN